MIHGMYDFGNEAVKGSTDEEPPSVGRDAAVSRYMEQSLRYYK